MRRFVFAAAVLALETAAALAQASLPAVLTKVDALSLRNACLSLAQNADGINDAVTTAGWKVEPMPGGNAYSSTSYGQLRFESAGRGALLWTTEKYPGYTYGFCRLDFPQIEAPLGLSGLAADASYKVESTSGEAGFDAAWSRTADGVSTLIVGHEDQQIFSLQVTVIAATPTP